MFNPNKEGVREQEKRELVDNLEDGLDLLNQNS